MEAFGTLLDHQGNDPNAYLFTGEPLDPNSGFYYNRARWLDPNAGRFASMDSLSGSFVDPIAQHKYLYAAADPLGLVDPQGLSFVANTLTTLQAWATFALVTFAPLLHAASRIAARLQAINVATFLRPAIQAFNSGAYRLANLNPRLIPLHAGRTWQAFLQLPMRLIGAVDHARKAIHTSRGLAYPDWIWQLRHIIDAKIGEVISVEQFRRFVEYVSARGGGSVNYITLLKPPPEVVQELQHIAGQAQNVTARIFFLIPF